MAPGSDSRLAEPARLSLAEHACLALICERATHGWEVGSVLSPDGAIGQVWSLTRPLTYRAIDQLADKGLIRRATGSGGQVRRQMLRSSARGTRMRDAWLDTPVDHLRQVRTEFMLKLVFAARVGRSRRDLLVAQQHAFAGRIETLTHGATPTDMVSLWRRESARSVRRFLSEALATEENSAPANRTTVNSASVNSDSVIAPAGPAAHAAYPPPVPPRMRLSARNQLGATIVRITTGDVMATVQAELPGGQVLTSAITMDSVGELDLATGDEVLVVIKSTEIVLAKP